MTGKPHWKPGGTNVKFKKAAGVTETEVRACHTIAQQAAEAIASTITTPWSLNLPAAEELHAVLKQQGAKPWVSLEDMVTWCWKHGIPVIHVNNFPRECTKPDGMAVRTSSGRPVVVLCKNSPRPAWQIFILAHELGHIALGHVPEGGVVVDSKLETETEESDEVDANRFAVTVLTGRPDFGLLSRGKMYPNLLAQQARQFANSYRVSPGVVALNWGFQTKDWGTANGAVKLLEEREDAFKIIQAAGVEAVDWESLSSDGCEWMERMTGLRQKA